VTLLDVLRVLGVGRRSLFRQPTAATLIAATVGIGVAGILVVMALAEAVYRRPLPYRADEELLFVFSSIPEQSRTHRATSLPNYSDWRAHARSVELEAATSPRSFTLTGVERPRPLSGEYVSAGYFAMLGVDVIAGRAFDSEDDRAGAAPVAILSERLAREQFGLAPNAVGRTLRLADRPFEVVGVLEPDYRGILWDPVDLWVPIHQAGEILGERYRTDRGLGWHLVLGRLRQGFSLAQARAELDDLAARLEELHPEANHGKRNHVETMRDFYFGDRLRRGLSYLLGASFLVLVLITANVVTLALAQSADSAREVAVRRALGASPSVLLVSLAAPLAAPLGIGLAAAIAISWWVTPWVISLSDIPPATLSLPWIDVRIGLLGGLLVLFVGLAVTLLAYRAHAGAAASLTLRSGGSSAYGRLRMLQRLVLLETTLAVVLLMGAGLLLRSLSGLRSGDPGFDIAGISALKIDLQLGRYEDPSARVRFVRSLLRDPSSAEAQVRGAAVSGPRLAPTANLSAELIPEDAGSEHDALSVYRHSISPALPAVLGLHRIEGRLFDDRDHEAAAKVALVSRSVAGLLGPEVLGRRFRLRPELPGDPWWTIVGVLEDVAARDLTMGSGREPDVYLPYEQAPEASFYLVTRSATDRGFTADQEKALAERVQRIDRDLALAPSETMEQRYALLTADERFNATVATCFSTLAWGLTILGLFGVLDLSVRSRRRELALRLALGATSRRLMRDVVLFALRLAVTGLLAGVALTLLAHRALRGLLVGVVAYDPATLTGVCAVVLLTAVSAAAAPALRTRRVDATAELTRGE
jgi:putative ABC transport system permease protein